MSGKKIELDKKESAKLFFEDSHSNSICNEVNVDFKAIYTNNLNYSQCILHLAYQGDQLQLVQLQSTHNDNRKTIFMEKYSKLMPSLFIDDYIYNDILFYRKTLGDPYASDGYALSQIIVEAFFNRFFT